MRLIFEKRVNPDEFHVRTINVLVKPANKKKILDDVCEW